MDELEMLRRKLDRERRARKQAENILEKKALELYRLNEGLEAKIAQRTTELRISEDKYRGIIENMQLGLLEVDNDQNIIRAYNWFCDMTGYAEEELLGQNALEFLSANAAVKKISREQNEVRKKGQAAVYELQIKHKKGHHIWVIISGSPVLDINGKVTGSIGIHYDITQRKILEQDLVKAKRAAELAQEAEKQFLASMSHEIRTPLNAIIGMSHLLQDSNPTPEQREYLSVLNQSSNILKLLISDILDFSKIQAGEIKLRTQEFNIWQLVGNLHKTIELRVEGKGILVSCQIDPCIDYYVLGDELLLNQILFNLLGNANKFTRKGEIGVIVTQLGETAEYASLEFKVFDTGIGIPLQDQERVFGSFKQVEEHKDLESSQKIDGTGLGLAITQKLVELQGGKISLVSAVNEGTTFTFGITYMKSKKIKQTQSEESSKIDSHQFTDASLLVVEDNHMNQKYIATLLNKWGLGFEFANDGLLALELAFVKPYDLIFMDISMPNMDGFETTISLRSIENPNRKTPIVALSALAFKQERKKALDIGMTNFLGKPFTPDALLNILETYLEPLPNPNRKKEKNGAFTFPHALNTKELESLYGDDYEYALEMFSLFLEHSLTEFETILPTIESGDFERIKEQTHRLKPNFSMVGLSELRNDMEQMEQLAAVSENTGAIFDLYKNVRGKLEKALPILEETTGKLRQLRIGK